MAGMSGRSGGANRLPVALHVSRGTFRPDRHRTGASAQGVSTISAADRRRMLRGLSASARRMATSLLDAYDGWDVAALATLRSYVLSTERLQTLEAAGDMKAIHRELRSNLALLKALALEVER